jgi:hypothetical protein
MLFMVIFILFLILILLIAIFTNVHIKFAYNLDGLDNHTNLIFSIFYDKIKYSLDLHPKEPKKPKIKDTSKNAGVFDKIENIKEVYGLIKILKIYLQNKLLLLDFDLAADIGTGDAYYTGLLSGLAWTASGMLISYISNTFTTIKKKINIKTNFMENKFKVELYCILSVKLVYIIVVLIKIILHSIKKKKLKAVV